MLIDRPSLCRLQVICDPSIEFIHGGLDKQVTHHLFPRIPRHNLRAASLLVKEFCKEQDLEFAEWGFQEGSRQVMSVVSPPSSLQTRQKRSLRPRLTDPCMGGISSYS